MTMKKYPKLRRIGHPLTDGLFEENTEVVIQEKVDGSNFRFHIDEEYNLTFGSRNVSYANVDEKDIPKSFRPTIEYVQDHLDRSSVELIVGDVCGPMTIFGESMHEHTLEYDWDDIPRFIGFDVWLDNADVRMSSNTALKTIEELGLPTINVIDRVGGHNFELDEYLPPESAYRDGKAEGLVLRNQANRTCAKYVTEAFAEKHGECKSGTEPDHSTEQKLADAYTGTNNQRIRKQIQKLTVDGTHELEMPLMEYLGPAVVEDIGVECGHELILERETIDMNELRGQINKRCVDTLKTMMQERAMGEL